MKNESLNQSFSEYEELTGNDLVEAKKDKCMFYKARETVYADPPYKNQNFTLFSWLPSSGCTPDDNGVYGMLKVRGTYEDENDMNKRAEYLVAHCDSFNRIYHAKNGVPVPLTLKEEHSREVKFVRQKNSDTDMIHSSVEDDKKRDDDIQKELDERVDKIKQEEKEGVKVETIDEYIQAKVKIAFNMNAIDTIDNQRAQSCKILKNANELVQSLEEANPEFKEQFMERFNNARRSIGVKIEDDPNLKQIEYMKYTEDDLQRYL
tara:strand:+ start:1427 stop:2215 length:789 start_codon:yes stop_codon:yes gene_type:complete